LCPPVMYRRADARSAPTKYIKIMYHFLIALQFLTIVPVRLRRQPQAVDLNASLLFFPLVGLLLGLVLTCLWLAAGFLPYGVRAMLVVLAGVLFTGGLHLDGLSDTVDGLACSGDKARRLALMRSGSSGPMGIAAMTLDILSRWVILSSMPGHYVIWAMPAGMMFSRWLQSFACAVFPYARPEGKGSGFIGRGNPAAVVFSGMSVLIVLWFIFGWPALAAAGLALSAAVIFLRQVNKKIGGVTGDVIGAVNEIGEVGFLFCALCTAG